MPNRTVGLRSFGILLVTVDREVGEFCRRELAADGYRVRLAKGADAALQTATQEFLDLIVLDLRIPRAEGLTLMKQFLVQLPRVPVILYSIRYARAFVETAESLAGLRASIAEVLRPRLLDQVA